MPDEFLSSVLEEEQGVKLPPAGDYAVGQVFMPQDAALRAQCREIMERVATDLGHSTITWRVVPTNNRSLGKSARDTEPVIEQWYVSASGNLPNLNVEQEVRGSGHGVRGGG